MDWLQGTAFCKFRAMCRNCLLKYVIGGKIEGRIEVTGRHGGRCKQLLDDLKEKRGSWKLKEEALDRTLRRTRFGRGCGWTCRETDCGIMNECMNAGLQHALQRA